MFVPSAPETHIVFNSATYFFADGALCVGDDAGLSPLVIDFCGIVFGDDVLAVWFFEFGVPADLMDDNSALFALQDVREESIGELLAEVAEIERFLL